MRLEWPAPALATRERATASRAPDSGVRRFVTHGVFPVVAQIWCRIARPPCSARSMRRDRTLTRPAPVRSSNCSHWEDHHPRGGVLGHHRQRQGQDSGQRRCVSCHSRANHDVVFPARSETRANAPRACGFPAHPRRVGIAHDDVFEDIDSRAIRARSPRTRARTEPRIDTPNGRRGVPRLLTRLFFALGTRANLSLARFPTQASPRTSSA